MEVVVCGALTILWWISSATILLPLVIVLKCNKSLRSLWFSYIYVNIQKIWFESILLPVRKKAFDLLKENLSERDESKPLKVLEIGIGAGANLQFYPENSYLTTLDKNINFGTYLRQNQKKYPHVVYERTIIAIAENMNDIEDSTMDVVISTYVFCSVTSIREALKEIRRVLKPNGKFLFLEHVSFPKSEWAFTIQKLTNPLWNLYADGCYLIRNPANDIKNAGFSDVISKSLFPRSLILYLRPQLYGLATK